ncbi:MAG TPA: helix-turn-helix domain-containing protein [Gemmatimonadaceae bacterium]
MPHPALRAHVSRYVQIALDVPRDGTMRHSLSALTGPAIAVFWSGQVIMQDIGAAAPLPPCSMIGPLTRWHDNVIVGPLQSFCVHFTPLGANALLHLRGGGIADRAVALADLLQPPLDTEVRAWADEVMHARSFAERVAATDRFFMRRLRRAASPPDLLAVAIARLTGDGEDRTRVSALASQLACSERTLRRHFREELGLSVKRFVRITRFQRAHAFLQRSSHTEWAGAVLRFGYVDQAHLIRDYREFAGTTPARYSAGERFLDTALTRRTMR